MIATGAGVVFAGLAGVVAVFQALLALGAPWGHLAMGGRWSGRMPPGGRIAAVFQGALMLVLARYVLGACGVLTGIGADWMLWVVMAVLVLSVTMNLATPSAPERRLWAPVAGAMVLACAVVLITR